MIPQNLIENALALTGKTIYDMKEMSYGIKWDSYWKIIFEFSYPKFFSYLLSPEFIEKCHELTADTINCNIVMTIEHIWVCIYEYQKWEYLFSKGEITEKQKDEYEAPIISLLEKIWPIQTYN